MVQKDTQQSLKINIQRVKYKQRSKLKISQSSSMLQSSKIKEILQYLANNALDLHFQMIFFLSGTQNPDLYLNHLIFFIKQGLGEWGGRVRWGRGVFLWGKGERGSRCQSLLIIKALLQMQSQKENYLTVTYSVRKGLVLQWNFQDLLQYETFFHHLFIVRQTNQNFLHQFFTQYYKKMKYGDLFSVLYFSSQKKGIKKSKWMEKTHLQNYQFSRLVSKMDTNQLTEQVKQAMTRMAVKQTSEGAQNFVVNFIIQQGIKTTRNNLQNMIQKGRSQGGFGYICSYFGNFNITDISYSKGINFLDTPLLQIPKTISVYCRHVNNAAVKRAEVTIESVSGQLISNNQKNWRNVEFNKLQKVFYGPSIKYQLDQIQFFRSENQKDNKMEIVINLNITLFSNQKLSNSKHVILTLPKEKFIEKSMAIAIKEPFFTSLGTWIASDPWSTLTVVRSIK